MLPKAVRAGLLCLIVGLLLSLSGCCCSCVCGIFGTCGKANCNSLSYPPCPPRACYGLHYCGECTCSDDVKDRINQVSDIYLP